MVVARQPPGRWGKRVRRPGLELEGSWPQLLSESPAHRPGRGGRVRRGDKARRQAEGKPQHAVANGRRRVSRVVGSAESSPQDGKDRKRPWVCERKQAGESGRSGGPGGRAGNTVGTCWETMVLEWPWGKFSRREGRGSSLEPRMSLRFRMGHCISGPEEWARPPNQGGKGSWWATGGGSACLRRPQGHRALQTVATGNLPQERPSLPTPPPVPSPGRREKPGCEHPDTAGVRQTTCSVPRECLTVPRHPYHVGASFPF